MDKKLWKYEKWFGRMGSLDSIFIATQEQVDEVIGKRIYFGEVLGKHSEIIDVIEKDDIELLIDDGNVVSILHDKLGMTISGYNPIDYYNELKEEGYYEEEDE